MRRHNFKKLHIWQEAMDLIDENYVFTATLPDYEKFGLRTQMNRCSVSIASNILLTLIAGYNSVYAIFPPLVDISLI